MASPVRRRLIQRTTNNVASLPAPVGGWNARDSLANMAPPDAVTLDNLFPGVSSVSLRGGYSKHATGMTGQVEACSFTTQPEPTKCLRSLAATFLKLRQRA